MGAQPWNKSVASYWFSVDVYCGIPHYLILLSPWVPPIGAYYHDSSVQVNPVTIKQYSLSIKTPRQTLDMEWHTTLELYRSGQFNHIDRYQHGFIRKVK